MAQLRKLLKLSKSSFALTIPVIYRKALDLRFGDYVEVALQDEKTITIRKHGKVTKQ